MSESEIVLPLDRSIWKYVRGMEASIGIPVSEDKVLDLFGSLYDVFFAYETDHKKGERLLIGLTALLCAAPLGQGAAVWAALNERQTEMTNFELKTKAEKDGTGE
jgi:hypothetical protein